MGLDMWIERRAKGAPEDQEREEVAYWRKVNWLHGYIVRELEGGDDKGLKGFPLRRCDIEGIVEKVDEAIAVLRNARLLPLKKEGDKYVVDPSKEPVAVCYANDGLAGVDQWSRYRLDDGAVAKLENLLPPTAGFFFGSAAYDHWYAESLFKEREPLARLLDEWDDEAYDYCYVAWW